MNEMVKTSLSKTPGECRNNIFLGKVSKRIFLRGKPPITAGVGAVVTISPLKHKW